jgi:trans-2-enoyl-CoA reductase
VVAQWSEQSAHNRLVGGSNPSRPTFKNMNKQEKQMEKYIKDLCRDADVEYDAEFGSHMDNHELNNLLKRDIQKQLDYMVAEGFCDQVGDKYVYRENPIDLLHFA